MAVDYIHQHRKNWILAYLLCFFISITEIIMLVVSGSSLAEMKGDILLVTGGMLYLVHGSVSLQKTYYQHIMMPTR